MTTPSPSPIDDIAFLARAEHRIPTLIALTVHPRRRSELWELTGVSSSTIRRTLREFEERNWIIRNEYQYEVTELGASVASACGELLERMETEQKLRSVWEFLPRQADGFSLDICEGAVVTKADNTEPYRPVNRFLTLLNETTNFRAVGFEVAILGACTEELCERVNAGMETEIIAPPQVANYVRENCPDLISESLQTGNLTIKLHDGLPDFGVCLFDNRIAIRGYDPDGVNLRVLVDSDTGAARSWAESIYNTYHRETPTIPMEPPEPRS